MDTNVEHTCDASNFDGDCPACVAELLQAQNFRRRAGISCNKKLIVGLGRTIKNPNDFKGRIFMTITIVMNP